MNLRHVLILFGGVISLFLLMRTNPSAAARPADTMFEVDCSAPPTKASSGAASDRRPLLTVSSMAAARKCYERGWVDAGSCISSEGGMRCLPSLVIAGTQKAATGTVRAWLSRHPQVRVGAGLREHPREVHYFDTKTFPSSNVSTEWGSYVERFPLAMESYISFDKTPEYMLTSQTVRRMASILSWGSEKVGNAARGLRISATPNGPANWPAYTHTRSGAPHSHLRSPP